MKNENNKRPKLTRFFHLHSIFIASKPINKFSDFVSSIFLTKNVKHSLAFQINFYLLEQYLGVDIHRCNIHIKLENLNRTERKMNAKLHLKLLTQFFCIFICIFFLQILYFQCVFVLFSFLFLSSSSAECDLFGILVLYCFPFRLNLVLVSLHTYLTIKLLISNNNINRTYFLR